MTATRAEVDTELRELRAQLAELKQLREAARPAEARPRETDAHPPHRAGAPDLSEETLKDLLKEIEALGQDKRSTGVITAFAAGYVLGRRR